jgi:hypothetical protein
MRCNQAQGVNNTKDTLLSTLRMLRKCYAYATSSICYIQSVALGDISVPRASSMLIGEFVADMDWSIQFSSWGTMSILDARASMVRCIAMTDSGVCQANR